ncbi:MAG: TOBE domain-containing protein, partial [Granulosicoccus sp.]
AYGRGETATVRRVEQLGDQTRLHLDFKGHAITALSPAGNPYAAGTTIRIEPENPLWFDEDGNRVAGRIS